MDDARRRKNLNDARDLAMRLRGVVEAEIKSRDESNVEAVDDTFEVLCMGIEGFFASLPRELIGGIAETLLSRIATQFNAPNN